MERKNSFPGIRMSEKDICENIISIWSVYRQGINYRSRLGKRKKIKEIYGRTGWMSRVTIRPDILSICPSPTSKAGASKLGPVSPIWPAHLFLQKKVYGTQACSFICILPMASLVL